MWAHLLVLYICTLDISVMNLHHFGVQEFKEWVQTEAPPPLHNLNLFCPQQVPVSTTHNTTTPTIPHTPVSSQQMKPLDNLSHNHNPTDHSPLNIMSPTHIFNEVCEFCKGIKHDNMLYPDRILG